jgi:DNA topoisomerase IA
MRALPFKLNQICREHILPIIRRGASGISHDKGLAGAGHHAVIPNVNTVRSLREIGPHLSNDERRLFDVIARSYLSAMMPDFRYRQTTVSLETGRREGRRRATVTLAQERRDGPAAGCLGRG